MNIDHSSQELQNPDRDRFSAAQKIGLFLSVAATSSVVAGPAIASYNTLDVSSEVSSRIVQPGETLWDIASDIENSNSTDIQRIVSYLQNMPENAATLEDGVLDQGETIVYPRSVK